MATRKLSTNKGGHGQAITQSAGGAISADIEITFEDSLSRAELYTALQRVLGAVSNSARVAVWGSNNV